MSVGVPPVILGPDPCTVLPQNEAGGQLSLGRNACVLDIWETSLLNHFPELVIYGGTVTTSCPCAEMKALSQLYWAEERRSKFDS